MTITRGTDGLIHPPDGGLHDHHAAPAYVEIDDTSTSIPPGSTANVDITLPRSDYQIARILIHGPKVAIFAGPSKEGSYIQATTSSSDGAGNCARDASGRQYGGTWAKGAGNSILTDYVFDSNTSSSNRWIAVQDCYITGSTLRFVMKNRYGGSATVWMKGVAILQ